MLRPKIVPRVLEQANTRGVVSSLLVNHEGSLISCAPPEDASAPVVAAIAANVWQSFERAGEEQVMLIECEEGNVAVTAVGKVLLCVVGGRETQLGMLKAKVQVLKAHMDEPLQLVDV